MIDKFWIMELKFDNHCNEGRERHLTDRSLPLINIGLEIWPIVTVVTPNQITFVITDRLILDPEAAGRGYFCQRGSGQSGTVAGLAAVLVVLIEVSVPMIVPAGVSDVVQAVGAACRPGQTAGRVTGLARDDGSGESLELYGG